MPPRGRLARRLGANLDHAARSAASLGMLARRAPYWVVLRLGGSLDEPPPPALPWAREAPLGLLDVLAMLESAGADPQVEGILLQLRGPIRGWSRALSLRRSIAALRERGTPVAVYTESLDAEGLLVASAATRLWLPPTGQLMPLGVRAGSFYLRGLLRQLQIVPERVRVGSHKTAGEQLARSSMSAEQREQLERYVDDVFAALVEGVATGRGLTADAVRGCIDRGPMLAPAAVEASLADGCLYPDQLDAELGRLVGRPEAMGPPQRVEGSVYRALRSAAPGWTPLLRPLARIAYVAARGPIHRGAGARGIACEPTSRLLDDLRRDPEVSGVVLRLESPGGEGTASDLLWRSVHLLRAEKPVVVSMGDVVASGGYYVASAAHEVFAEAATLTGSIGVVGGKINLGGLYEQLGVGKDFVERGARAGLFSEARGFTPGERAALRRHMAGFYRTFVDRVAEGRGLSREEVGRAAQGRVFSGASAIPLGLVDALGGPLEALRAVRARAGLAADERAALDVLPRRTRWPSLSSLLPGPPGRLDAS